MTIEEFLTARLADDEHHADQADQADIAMYGGVPFYRNVPGTSTRTRRDVAAKRAIIEAADEATGYDMQVDGEFRVGSRNETEEPYVGDVILRALASVYADHPDYRTEWAV
ncbi:MAG: DUF6221 family protein [Rhodococcus sp. (in: high G+C Gram-positive bacteria)]|uniref:DUF6221 family protein n=1 Tax=Rhodococcus sp. TaxID=1831 RepID=UPI002ADB8B6E|nr:DUF6221 family protein [Rhodococcus sp. (in: high G+C Gram-positive bacteria)]